MQLWTLLTRRMTSNETLYKNRRSLKNKLMGFIVLHSNKEEGTKLTMSSDCRTFVLFNYRTETKKTLTVPELLAIVQDTPLALVERFNPMQVPGRRI